MLNSQPRIVTIGGGEIAHIAHCPKIPSVNETVPARDKIISVSGKGASQAAAMSILGSDTHFIGCLGNDANGDMVINCLKACGVNTELVTRAKAPTATSLVMVDYEGDNIKAYHPGANLKLTVDDVRKAKGIIAEADLMVCQLETHNSVLEYAIGTASRFGVPVVLNSSPALPYDYNLYSDISVLVMNDTEAEYYTGLEILTVDDARKCAETILDDGVRSVVLTLGGMGCLVSCSSGSVHIAPPKVKTIDSTSAGDVFTGALCWSLACGSSLEYSADLACKAAALSVTVPGAIESIPTLEQITEKFGETIEEILHIA